MLDWTASGRPEHQPPARRLPRNGNRRRERSGDSEQRPAKALEFLKRARHVAANGNDMGTALTWMARARQSEPEGGPEAESLYREAMAAADANSAEQAPHQGRLRERERRVRGKELDAVGTKGRGSDSYFGVKRNSSK
jgi:hypothetical protein